MPRCTGDRQRVRAIVNRFIFRAMLFSMGSIAVVLHRVLPWKGVAWAFARVSARNLARLCGVRVHVHGLEHLTGPGPYIFAPNHQSNFDIPALLGYLPGSNRFVAKKELFAEPILGTVLRTLGMIPVDRDNPLEAIQLLNQVAIEERCSLIIFPEGTRSARRHLAAVQEGRLQRRDLSQDTDRAGGVPRHRGGDAERRVSLDPARGLRGVHRGPDCDRRARLR